MRVLLLALFVLTASACGDTLLSPEPASGPPADQVDCRGFEGEITDCLAVEAAAARLVDAEPGSRVEVSTVSPDMSHVAFVGPSGARRSADVIFSPDGQYAAVDPSYGPGAS